VGHFFLARTCSERLHVSSIIVTFWPTIRNRYYYYPKRTLTQIESHWKEFLAPSPSPQSSTVTTDAPTVSNSECHRQAARLLVEAAKMISDADPARILMEAAKMLTSVSNSTSTKEEGTKRNATVVRCKTNRFLLSSASKSVVEND
jgi:hypothetical protein